MARPFRVPMVFGRGLDRETGSMAMKPGSMEDLRNVVVRQGKLALRRGTEDKLAFTDENGVDITHILAGQSLRGERSGLVVGYQGNSGAGAYGQVYIYRLDADATVQDRIGKWFKVQNLGGDPAVPPSVITAESFGMAFFAHDEFRQNDRAATLIYDPFSGEQLRNLTGKFRDTDGDGTYEEEEIAFRGVVAHLDYLWGWGFGTQGNERSEFVRFSRAGAPDEFDRNAYFIPGSQRDPTIACEPAGDRLIVFKETETWHIVGYHRDEFGTRRVDERFGCLAPRLSASVTGTVFAWSAEGPRATEGGPLQDISIPLELKGVEPSDLPDPGDLANGFAAYIPEEQVVLFVFGQRVYALSVRGQQPAWSYWELGFTPQCAFSLYATGVGAPTASAPTGHPEWKEAGATSATDEVVPTWINRQPDGDEFVEIWLRKHDNLFGNVWPLDTDDDADGVANGLTKGGSLSGEATYSIDQEAQKISVVGASAGGVASAYRDTPAAPGDVVTASSESMAGNLSNGRARIRIEWLDAGDVPLGEEIINLTNTDFDRKYVYEKTAPANTATARIHYEVEVDAAGDDADGWFRHALVYKESESGAWYRSESAPVNPTDGSEQDWPVDIYEGSALEPGTFYEVALRYRRSNFVTAGYEGDADDVDSWPDTSKGLTATATTSIDAPVIVRDYYTVNADAVTGDYTVAVDLDVQISQATFDALQEAEAKGFDWELQIHRKVPNYDDGLGTTVNESNFQQVASVGSNTLGFSLDDFTPDFGDPLGVRIVDRTIYLDHFVQADEFEYFARLEMETELGTRQEDSETILRWPGRYDPPSELRESQPSSWPPAQFDENLEGGTVQIALHGTYPEDYYQEVHLGSLEEIYDRIVSLVPLGPPNDNRSLFTPYVRVQWRNVTDATGWSDLGIHDSRGGWGRVNMDAGGVADFTVYLEGLLSGKTYEFRAKTHVELSDDQFVRARRFESDWSGVFSYDAP